jgi:hypothetical protein
LPEDVAEFVSSVVWVVGDVSGLGVSAVIVGGGNENVASGEGVETIVCPSFDLVKVPKRLVFSDLIELRDEFVGVRVSIHASPEGFSVVRVVSTIEILLGSVVNDWDTLGEH